MLHRATWTRHLGIFTLRTHSQYHAAEFLNNLSGPMACQCQQLPVGAQTAPTYLLSSCTKHSTVFGNATETGLKVVGQKTFSSLRNCICRIFK